MESGRWAEYSSNEVIKLLSAESQKDFDSIWESLSQLMKEHQTEEKGVLTAQVILSEEQLLTTRQDPEAEEETVVTAQLIASQEDSSLQIN